MKKLAFLGVLAVVAVAVWFTSAPVTANSSSIIGGDWWPYWGAYCCVTIYPDNCANGQVMGLDDCAPGYPFWVLDVSEWDYWGSPIIPGLHCMPKPEPYDYLCGYIYNSHCGSQYPEY